MMPSLKNITMQGLLLVGIFASFGITGFGCGSDNGFVQGHAALGTEQLVDSTDFADTNCELVLHSVEIEYNDQGNPAKECDEDGCHRVVHVMVDIAADLETPPVILYHRDGDPDWWEKQTSPKGPGGPGFMRYEVHLWEHLSDVDSPQALELIPFARLDGARIFDHNVVLDPLGCYYLGATQGFLFPAESTCTHRPETSALIFDGGWNEFTEGTLRAGGKVAIDYEPSRLPDCRAAHDGYPAWGMFATIQFLPGGQTETGGVVQFRHDQEGRPMPDFYPVPFIADIPEDATEAVVWFHNESGAGNYCDTWDSDFGANYHFDVKQPRDLDPCADQWQWDHNEWATPTCQDYAPSENYNATNCEFYLDSISNVLTGHYGIPEYWLEADLIVTPQAGDVAAVGLYAEYLDRSDATMQHAWVYGWEVEPGRWRTGLNYLKTIHPRGGSLLEVRSFAFFIDQRRDDGSVARLWLSNSGKNYHWDDAFGIDTHRQYIPYGSAYYADGASAVFDSKRSCH